MVADHSELTRVSGEVPGRRRLLHAISWIVVITTLALIVVANWPVESPSVFENPSGWPFPYHADHGATVVRVHQLPSGEWVKEPPLPLSPVNIGLDLAAGTIILLILGGGTELMIRYRRTHPATLLAGASLLVLAMLIAASVGNSWILNLLPFTPSAPALRDRTTRRDD